MTNVIDNTLAAEGLGDFFKNLGKKELNISKKLAKDVLNNPGRALGDTANVASAVSSRNFKAALSILTEMISFHHTGKGVYLRKFV